MHNVAAMPIVFPGALRVGAWFVSLGPQIPGGVRPHCNQSSKLKKAGVPVSVVFNKLFKQQPYSSFRIPRASAQDGSHVLLLLHTSLTSYMSLYMSSRPMQYCPASFAMQNPSIALSGSSQPLSISTSRRGSVYVRVQAILHNICWRKLVSSQVKSLRTGKSMSMSTTPWQLSLTSAAFSSRPHWSAMVACSCPIRRHDSLSVSSSHRCRSSACLLWRRLSVVPLLQSAVTQKRS